VPAAPAAKSGDLATVLAVGTTAGGVTAMIAATTLADRSNLGTMATLALVGFGATLVGPAAGHLYAGEYGHALGTTVLRGAAVGTIVFGLTANTKACWADCDDSYDGGDNDGAGIVVVGTAALVGLTAYDLWDAHKAAARRNARNDDLRVTPTALATAHGPVAGLAVAGRF
jgi:hypothetical protein